MQVSNGWPMLTGVLAGLGVCALLVIAGATGNQPWLVVVAILGVVALIITSGGFFILQPNEAAVLSFFGPYLGTVYESGFYWYNPFATKRKISVRARNFEGNRLKVNDKQGNPIEIAAVVVYKVEDTFKACFDVENFEQFVEVQSETALRHLANSYAYDHGEEHEITLRSSQDEVSAALTRELQDRLVNAGVNVLEARLTHLAYAAEIAGVMLRRQHAEAVIAARQKIVHGAVSMVDMALRELGEKSIVQFDEPQKAALVSNLMIVLCSESHTQPVISTAANPAQ